MTHLDTCQRFMMDNSAIRGEWCLLDATFKSVITAHDYPLEVQGLLGEMMAAAALLSSTLKFEGTLILQARGEGPIQLATVECTHNKNIRAVAHWQGDVSNKGLRELLGKAQLAITISPNKGKSYQGIVPLTGETLAKCLEHYFKQSEQLDTRVFLNQGNDKAAGLLLQIMPFNSNDNTPEEQQHEDWTRICTLASTLTAEEHLSISSEELLNRLFHEEEVRLFDPVDTAFKCTCSRDRMGAALLSMGKEETENLLTTQEKVTITCDYCNTHHEFDKIDIHVLFESTQPDNQNKLH